MESDESIVPVSNATLWVGRAMSGLSSLFLLMDGVMKLFAPPVVVETTVRLGYQESVIAPLGIVLLLSTALYVIPRTSVLGAILLTGYLGGAVATHVRVSGGVFEMIFPVIIGALLWGGLVLRYPRVRAVMPLQAG
jgi:hypothetical protein